MKKTAVFLLSLGLAVGLCTPCLAETPDSTAAGQTVEEDVFLDDDAVRYEGVCGAEGDGSNLQCVYTAPSKYSHHEGILTISGEGEMGELQFDGHDTSVLLDKVKKIYIQEGVTSVSHLGYSGVEELSLPDSLLTIEDNAFRACANLKDFELPENLQKIGSYAFASCTSLTSVSVPGSEIEISHHAFADCTSLTDVYLYASSMGGYVLQSCTSLSSVTLAGSLTDIAQGTFEGCTSLEEIKIPSGITSVGIGAFLNCTALQSVSIPNSVTKIDNQVFQGCTALQAITLPNALQTIGWGAFKGCSALKSIVIPDSVTHFKRSTSSIYTFEGCTALEEVTLSTGFNSLPKFSGCISLATIHWPANVTCTLSTADDNLEGTALTDIYYGGTRAQWDSMAGSASSVFANATIHCAADTATQTPAPDNSEGGTNYGDGVTGFVTRLYDICLGREPDAAGLADWANRLQNGELTGAEAAAGFVFSPEYQNSNPCNECFVTRLYRAFMGREPDAAGLSSWLDELANGKTRGQVFNGFANSAEFDAICQSYGITRGEGDWSGSLFVLTGDCAYCGAKNQTVYDFVTRLYSVCLDREPDEAGLADWVDQLKGGKTGRAVASGFIFSQEFTDKGLADADYVEYLYKAFMGRDSDEGGKADWVGRLAAGASREDVFNGFAASQEFTNICANYGIIRG